MLVFDLRSDPVNPWFQVVGDGSADAPAMPAAPAVDARKSVTSDTPTARTPRQWPPVRALTWSADSLQQV
ncbi:hypothetical protein HaLaN_31048 [Haematococcus lacustris]|uniref:Uncharacterized protein n=1 Tax=Haematococcus lacustris TaxID=44745 RepID=A0A6A0AGY6_HAELA|nr:hypothetical protein HaLaN_31048 [Haematococcus lacustris]